MTTVVNEPSSSPRLVAFASSIGTAIEWYDFFIYGTASALVFNKLFFPEFDPAVGTMAAFATFTVGFIARPFGGVIFGHFGDRIGRKTMLILTLMIMGIGTGLVGLLPTYAAIGVWAPLLLILLRVLQGIGLGGEWGGAVLMAVEYAPEGRRGFYGALPQAGVPVGLVAGTGAFALVTMLPDEALYSWGWRVPFLISFALVAVGILIRLKVEESPVFETMKTSEGPSRAPLVELLKHDWRHVLLGIGLRYCENGSFYVYTTFILVYGTQFEDWSKSQILVGVMVGAVVAFFTIPLAGLISDRVGRRPIFMTGTVLAGLLAFPLFMGVESGSIGWMWLAIASVLGVAYAAMYGPEASFMSELFPTHVRYSGISVSAQFAGIVAGGVAPLIATALLARAGHYWPVAVYLIVMAAISFFSALVAPETLKAELEEVQSSSPRRTTVDALVEVAASPADLGSRPEA